MKLKIFFVQFQDLYTCNYNEAPVHLFNLKIKEMQKEMQDFNWFVEYTGFSRAYAYKLLSQRKVSYYKPLGKKVYFNVAEIKNWLSSKRIKSIDEIEQEATDLLTTKRAKQ